mmetsp:Transcript_2933/g.5969  ORF Transcript_2933/g.5969 Transcript_2933/m.5969 type:complete len:134 (-) Transcript_2933:1728-2129(-)
MAPVRDVHHHGSILCRQQCRRRMLSWGPGYHWQPRGLRVQGACPRVGRKAFPCAVVSALTESSEDDDALVEEDASSWEYRIQSVVAIFLLGALGLSAANVLLKIGVIAFALVSVAVRYTIIGILLVVLLFWFL